MYKKIFTIKHNNKSFVIFVNEKHRFVFMEQRGNELVYPDYEDFIYLFNLYNVDHGVVSDTSTLIGERVSPPEKVSYKGLLLSVIYALNLSYALAHNPAFSIKDDKVIIENVEKNKHVLPKSVSELNKYLGYRHISVEELFKAIDENDSFNERQREITKNIITEKLKLNPDMDLRLFYENVKTLKIVNASVSELEEKFNESLDGCYASGDNTIYLSSDKDGLFAHEISHVMHTYWRVINGEVIYINAGRSSLYEMVTDREGELGVGHTLYGYGGQNSDMGRALTYLLKHSDKFSYKIYDEYGLDPLFDELKEKYPNVDIDFIIDYYNAYHKNYVSLEYEEISIFDNEYLLDQFYEMAILNIDKDNVLGSLKDLIELIKKNDEYCKKYSNKYYNYLRDNSLISNDMFDFLSKINNFVMKDNQLYIGTTDNKYYYGDELRDITDDCLKIPLTQNIRIRILDDYLMGTSIDEIYLSKIIGEENILDANFIYIINDYTAEEVDKIYHAIFNVMMENCSSLEELQEQYLKFIDMFHKSHRYLTIYGDVIYELKDDFLDEYLHICTEKKYITENDSKIIKNVSHIIYYNGNYYLVKKISNPGCIEYNQNCQSDDFVQSTCLARGPVGVTYLDENGNENYLIINREVYVEYEITDSGSIKMQTFLSNHDSKQLSQEYLSSLVEECGMINNHLYDNVFKLSNGEVIYDGELDDSILIEFGKEENMVTYQIIKDDKVLYKSCDNFVPLSSKVSYKMFLSFLDYKETEYMDKILNNSEIMSGLSSLNSVIKETKVKWNEYATVMTSKDGEGKTTYSFKQDIEFIKPLVVNMDGQSCYARDIVFFSSSEDGWLYVNFPDGTLEPVFDLNQLENFYPEDEFIFDNLEKYIELYNLQPNENGIYELTREQIIDLVVKDYNEDLNKDKSK